MLTPERSSLPLAILRNAASRSTFGQPCGEMGKSPRNVIPIFPPLSLSLPAALPRCGAVQRVLPGTVLPLWALWGPPWVWYQPVTIPHVTPPS